MSDPIRSYNLCPDCERCPTVEFRADGTVAIGEPPNVTTLSGAQWNELVNAVRCGVLTEIA
jgi:sarcosine oxidase delta subunit